MELISQAYIHQISMPYVYINIFVAAGLIGLILGLILCFKEVNRMTFNWKELLNIDLYMTAFYGLAQAFSWLVWAAVGLLLAKSYGLTFPNRTTTLILALGFSGVYYYGIRKYYYFLKHIKGFHAFTFAFAYNAIDAIITITMAIVIKLSIINGIIVNADLAPGVPSVLKS